VEERRRRVDHHEREAFALEGCRVFAEPDDIDRSKDRGLGRALVPSGGQEALRVAVHHGHRSPR
jgi:hypothetical protein